MLRHGLRVTTVLVTGAATTVLSWSAGRWWLNSGHAPVQVGWLVGVLLVAMAAVLLYAGRPMWRMRRGKGHVEPLVAARLLGLAQASALTGAITGGIYLGLALVLVPEIGFAGRGEMALKLGLAALGAALIAVAGMLVQRWCRIDRDDDDEDDEASEQRSGG